MPSKATTIGSMSSFDERLLWPSLLGGLWPLARLAPGRRGRPHHTEERKSVMTDPTGRNGVKTLGIKLPSELHAQFALVAQLDELNLGDAVLRAVELYVQTKRSEPDF